MIDGSAGSSLQSLRALSSENSEFELVDIVSSPRLTINSDLRKNPSSSVSVVRTSTNSPVVQNSVVISKSGCQSSIPYAAKEVPEICDYEQTKPNSINILLENERLRKELSEARAQLDVMSEEIEKYRQQLREDGRKVNPDLQLDVAYQQKSNLSSREFHNHIDNRNTSKSVEAKAKNPGNESTGESSDKATTEPKNRFKAIILPDAQTFPRTHCKTRSNVAATAVRAASSPPLPRLGPPRTVADAQLLDLLGDVQPMRDANRPAAPPPRKNSWCKVCGQWLCNSYFLRAHMHSQHAPSNGNVNGKENRSSTDPAENGSDIDISNQKSTRMAYSVLFDSAFSQRLIDINDEMPSLPPVVKPKPIRPIPSDKFRIKWEEDDEETEEEDGSEHVNANEKDPTSWSLIGRVSSEPMADKSVTNSKDCLSGPFSIAPVPSPSLSPALSSIQKQHPFYSSADSALTSSTASSTMMSSSPHTSVENNQQQSPDYGPPKKPILPTHDSISNQTKPNSLLDDSILNRLLSIDPPPPVKNANNRRSEDIARSSAFRQYSNELVSSNNEFCKLRDDFRILCALYEQKDRQRNEQFDSLEKRIIELNAQLGKFDILTGRFRDEQQALKEELKLENGRLSKNVAQQHKDVKDIQNQVEVIEQCHLRQFVATLPPILKDGSLVLSESEKGIYCVEIKLLVQSGSRFCSGLAIKGSAHFRNYPSNLFDQLIEHALTTQQVSKMIRWAVLNFPPTEKCPWPQLLLLTSDDSCPKNMENNDNHNNIYGNLVRKRAVLSDRVVYSLRNQHSAHKFVVNIYYASSSELFKQMHCFTIRRQRSPRCDHGHY